MSADLTPAQVLIGEKASRKGLRVTTDGPNPKQPYLMVGHPDDGNGTYVQIVAVLNVLTWNYNHHAFVGEARSKSPRKVSLAEARRRIEAMNV